MGWTMVSASEISRIGVGTMTIGRKFTRKNTYKTTFQAAKQAARRHECLVEMLESRVHLSTYYVATTGSDSAAGGASAPWKTLQKAADTAVAGDTVIVNPGTYAGMDMNGTQYGGTATNPITFIANTGDYRTSGVTLNAMSSKGSGYAQINIEASKGNIIVEGFNVTGGGAAQKSGIRVSGSNNVQVLNNQVSGAFTGIFVSISDKTTVQGNLCHDSTDQHGIYFSGDTNFIARGNTLYGNAWDGLHLNMYYGTISTGGLIEGNTIYGNTLSGIDMEGTTNDTFLNNIIYGNQKHGISLHNLDQASTPADTGCVFANNTITGNGMHAIQIADGGNNANTFFNNILLAPSGYNSFGVTAPLYADYNIESDKKFGAHDILSSASSLFVNSGSNDYHLKAGAVAIDAGAASFNGFAAPTIDFESDARPQGAAYDIGADEYRSQLQRQPLLISGTSGDDQIYVKNSSGTLKWWIVPAAGPAVNPATDTPTGTAALAAVSTLGVQGLGGDDTITLDLSGGILSATTGGGVSVDGGAGDDYLLLKGVGGTLVLSAFPATVGAEKIVALAGVEDVGFGDGTVSLAGLPAGMGLTASGSANVTLTASMTLPSLEISGTAKVSLAPGGSNTLVISPATPTSISFTLPADTSPTQPFVGLDLNDNGLIVKAGNLADRNALLNALSGLIQRSRNAFASLATPVLWAGNGIRSNTAAVAAAADTANHTGLTGIAITPNVTFGPTGLETGQLKTTFEGQGGLDTNTILLAYTYNGDVNLDGRITFDDYAQINQGFLSGGSGYWNGDFDYGGKINFDDYSLLNQAFLNQGALAQLAPMAISASPFSTLAVAPTGRPARVW
jgi:parallel beta-helix repeat protein